MENRTFNEPRPRYSTLVPSARLLFSNGKILKDLCVIKRDLETEKKDLIPIYLYPSMFVDRFTVLYNNANRRNKNMHTYLYKYTYIL